MFSCLRYTGSGFILKPNNYSPCTLKHLLMINHPFIKVRQEKKICSSEFVADTFGQNSPKLYCKGKQWNVLLKHMMEINR